MMTDPPETESKGAFAKRLGVTAGRVSQWIKAGLPLTDDGKQVRVVEALDWLAQTLDPGRVAGQRRPRPATEVSVAEPPDDDIPAGDYLEAKRHHEWVKCRRAKLEYDRAAGELIDAAEARREAFARGRAERDSWLAWLHRVAPVLAAELQSDEHTLFVALEREITDHLSWLADTPLNAMGATDGDH